MTPNITVTPAKASELEAAQIFYESRGYGGAAITANDFVVLAKDHDRIVGVGRLTQEHGNLWLRGMQVEPSLQRNGIGSRILHLLESEIGSRVCCCLPYSHLHDFYEQAGFELRVAGLPEQMRLRLANYLKDGLDVIAMIRPAKVTA